MKGKASFWMKNALFSLTFAYYLVRFDRSDIQMSFALLSWWPATFLVVYSLNYIRPTHLPNRWFTIGYWFTLIIYLAETLCVVVAVTLAVQQNIIPVIEGKDVDYSVRAFAILVVIIRSTFALFMFSFFFNKIFNGRKDLI